jgi:hypothetical protein
MHNGTLIITCVGSFAREPRQRRQVGPPDLRLNAFSLRFNSARFYGVARVQRPRRRHGPAKGLVVAK